MARLRVCMATRFREHHGVANRRLRMRLKANIVRFRRHCGTRAVPVAPVSLLG